MSLIRSGAIIAVAACLGCAASHVRSDGSPEGGPMSEGGSEAATIDGGGVDAGSSDGASVFDFGCSLMHPRFSHVGCTPDDVAACNAWGGELAGPGEFAHVTALEAEMPRGACTCLIGNLCSYPGGNASCSCDHLRTCNVDEMCVSDTLDGPLRCQRAACLPVGGD